ncbi:MAG: hypothetical protein KF819_29835 [Labilithrix sp.]|nr:hypothetical protein [Labilithrix sp.]
MPRRDDTAGKVPDWASMFAPEEWAWFVATLATDLERRGLRHRFDLDVGCVHIDRGDAAARPDVLGLANLSQICRARPRDAWNDAIRHHFDVAFDVGAGRTAEELSRDWLLARDAVKLRLYVQDELPDVPLVTWALADGLVAVLTFDLPESVVSVRQEDRARWSVGDDEVFDVALANVRGEGLLPRGKIDVGEGASVGVLEGGSTFFAATHALFLDEYDAVGPHGTLVAVPHRHTVIYHPIEDLRVVRALDAMIQTTARMHADGPGSISADLYWLRPDTGDEDDVLTFVRLPCEIEADTLRFRPPAEFVALLDALDPSSSQRRARGS